MIFNYRNIHDLIISWARKDPQLHEALKRINASLIDVNKFLNEPNFEKIHIGSAIFNSDRNALSQASAMTQACRVYKSAVQSIPDSTNTAIQFNTVRYDTDGMFDSVTNTRITFKAAGKYSIGGCIEFAAIGPGATLKFVQILLNGTTILAKNNIDNAGTFASTLSTEYIFAQNDYIELIVWQNSGAALNLNASLNYSPEFWAHRLS